MSFAVAADDYDRFMGRYSRLLAPQLADLADLAPGHRVLDVGCGPGALTEVLIGRLGPEAVTAVDPSEPFVTAVRDRFPAVEVRRGSAEELPFDDGQFDRTFAQLVVHFMSDPLRGLGEMRRVTRQGGLVAACVWDLAGRTGPLSMFWTAARSLDPDVLDETQLAGGREGGLVALFSAAGLHNVEGSILAIQLEHSGFEEWWSPFTAGVGPAGAYLAALDPDRRAELEQRCRAMLPGGPFVVQSRAWAARGVS